MFIWSLANARESPFYHHQFSFECTLCSSLAPFHPLSSSLDLSPAFSISLSLYLYLCLFLFLPVFLTVLAFLPLMLPLHISLPLQSTHPAPPKSPSSFSPFYLSPFRSVVISISKNQIDGKSNLMFMVQHFWAAFGFWRRSIAFALPFRCHYEVHWVISIIWRKNTAFFLPLFYSLVPASRWIEK